MDTPFAGRRVARLLAVLAVALTVLAASASAALAAPRWGSGAVAERNLNGMLEVFASDIDGDIWHKWQLGTGGWSNWAEFPFSAQFGLARPGVARNRDGRLEIFAQSGSRMYHKYQLAPGGSWSGWADFGGGFASTVFTQPIATAAADGHLELFAVNPSGDLVRRHQLAPNGSWGAWQNLGGDFDPRAIPAVTLTWDGKLEVFLPDRAGAVQHRWQLAPNGSWSGWASLGGDFMTGAGWGVAAARNSDGRLEVYATSRTDRRLYHRWQTVKGGGWNSSWAALGGEALVNRPVVARHVDGRLELLTPRNMWVHGGLIPVEVLHSTQNTSSTGWSAWSALGGGGPGIYQTPAIAINADGRMEAFVQKYDGSAIFHSWQIAPGGSSSWSSWDSLG